MMTKGKVSVILPVYNGESYLLETLESIRAQTYRPIELIIVNDGSVDSSRDICLEWINKVALEIEVRFFDNFLNLGVCNALRKSCEAATGEFIAQIGHDDVWKPNHLLDLVDSLNSSPNAVASFSNVEYINGHGEEIKIKIFDHKLINSLTQYKLFARLLSGNVLCAPGSLFRARNYRSEFWGLQNERLQDHRLWMHLLLEGEFILSDTVSVSYRVHQNNLSSAHVMQLQGQLEFFELHQKIMFSDKLFQIFDDLYIDYIMFEEFITAIYDSVLQVEEYFPPLRYNLMVWLEKVQERYPLSSCVTRLRSSLLCSLGAIRKSLLISKSDVSIAACAKRNSPFLVPVDSKLDHKLFQFLVETGWFRDGRGIDPVGSSRDDFFVIASKEEFDGLRKDENISTLASRRRMILASDRDDVLVGDQCIIPIKKEKIGHNQLDQIFRFIEGARMVY
ncbi:hypothetical protein CAF53_25500 (plasmid) [Sphingobium sp. LB126]|uniref:glycosyltransferase n=1 Tax=Sphingobium sp. LB126 TaxID=1983755 RepID=UPI000C202213|nr:glycosyltransferase [Sphingobium sp. LB126]PJG45161.1 hypothetical protein CAF53_25500 [Sphingobium sp. LB126]